jgi:hypothetical protein
VGNSSSPKLLPLGLFSTPITNLSMMDVRFSVSPEVFQQYLTFFSKFLLTVRTKTDGGVGMHTVRVRGKGAAVAAGRSWLDSESRRRVWWARSSGWAAKHSREQLMQPATLHTSPAAAAAAAPLLPAWRPLRPTPRPDSCRCASFDFPVAPAAVRLL